MEPRIETLPARQLIGLKLTMSLANNQTSVLWQRFMPLLPQVPYAAGPELYSLQVYPLDYFAAFNPGREFEKWAAVAVFELGTVPAGLESFQLPAGLYAVFSYKGSSADTSIYQYIFSSWLPASAYVLDDRPQFELLGEKYRNNDTASEEGIYIPIKKSNASRS
ncbi:hypothetical protein GCM10023185_23100 [Hymenobacter saemangeumensis]|uniref:AraC effector-binding domain-containing protein n=1 Tax=Hymenobacter saemangeumensis TaxID=1084522 RepID=A0ABP8IGE3_9BACT